MRNDSRVRTVVVRYPAVQLEITAVSYFVLFDNFFSIYIYFYLFVAVCSGLVLPIVIFILFLVIY